VKQLLRRRWYSQVRHGSQLAIAAFSFSMLASLPKRKTDVRLRQSRKSSRDTKLRTRRPETAAEGKDGDAVGMGMAGARLAPLLS
jgi:hypothetical protein